MAVPAMAEPSRNPAPRFSEVQLRDAHRIVDRRLAKAPAGVAYWGEEPGSNRVVVHVVRSDPAALAAARSAIKDVSPTKIVLVSERPRLLWSVIGGQSITSRGRCSVGLSARTGKGARYVVTAGHCTSLGGAWRGVGGNLGRVSATSFPGDDFGLIRALSPAGLSTARVDRYSSGSAVTVSGVANPTVGSAICRSGSTTGWRCGTVQANNQTVNYGDGDVVTGLTRTTACAEPGDSGGSYVTNPGNGTRVTSLGLLSGGTGNCRSGGTTFFQPIIEALDAYGLTAVTG